MLPFRETFGVGPRSHGQSGFRWPVSVCELRVLWEVWRGSRSALDQTIGCLSLLCIARVLAPAIPSSPPQASLR